MRLLFCQTCKTLEEIDDLGYDLVEGEVDPLVEALVLKHTQKDAMGHGSSHMNQSPFRLINVDDLEWATERERLIRLINTENKKVGFDGWVYESMNTFADDALKCYSAHHRPKQGCIDWWDESKRIGRPTVEGQQAVKDLPGLGDRDPHLCQYCPVASYVRTEINHRKGLYKEH